MIARLVTIGLVCGLATGVAAQAGPDSTGDAATSDTAAPSEVAPAANAQNEGSPSFANLGLLSRIQIHGFVSEGGFISTDNEYIGESSRGSFKLFEAGINISAELLDRLRVGIQLVSRSVGSLSEEVPRLDWAVADYQWKSWLGMRAGTIKMPLGLYNEYVDIDAARTAILLPQGLYPLRNRDALISHTGFAVYGSPSLGPAGSVDYQAWAGTLNIPRSALTLQGATLDSVDTKYVAGGQLFWRPPIEGLRVGATFVRMSIDFQLTLAADTASQLIMAGLAPSDYRGQLRISQRPSQFWVVSAEYIRGNLLLAAEYSRATKHQTSSLPAVMPTIDEDAETFYAMATYRLSPHVEVGTYYSVSHADAGNRRGRGSQFPRRVQAFQRDLAGTLRLDVNQYWLWKLEAHFIDGAAHLQTPTNPNPTRYWGLFLLRTTVTF